MIYDISSCCAGHFQASETNSWRDSNMFSSSMCFFASLMHGMDLIWSVGFILVHDNYHSLQFSNLGPLEAHGFARNRFWSIDNNPPPLQANTSSKTFVDLILKPSEDDAKVWPHRYNVKRVTFTDFLKIPYTALAAFPFQLLKNSHASVNNNIIIWLNCSYEYRLRVALGPAGELLLTSRVRNTNADGKPFSFTFAYHTYFSVSDIRY